MQVLQESLVSVRDSRQGTGEDIQVSFTPLRPLMHLQ